MQELRVSGFEKDRLIINESFWGPQLFCRGVRVKVSPFLGKFTVSNDAGKVCKGRIIPFLFILDPLNAIELDGQRIEIKVPLKWFEEIWGLWPILLIIFGLIGNVLAFVALFLNIRIFRSQRKTVIKYMYSFLISLTFTCLTVFVALLGTQIKEISLSFLPLVLLGGACSLFMDFLFIFIAISYVIGYFDRLKFLKKRETIREKEGIA